MSIYWENWKRYWKEQLAHVLVGFVIGATFNIPLAALVAKRQDLEFQKRNDTPGIDMAYHVAGATAGAVCLVGVGLGIRAGVLL